MSDDTVIPIKGKRKRPPKVLTKEGKGRGRPSVEEKNAEFKEQFESLCAIQCTLLEICAVLKCDQDTINNFCKRTYGRKFSDIYDEFAAYGCASIRRKQFQLAMSGNVKLLEILGQNRLGQVKKVKQQTDATIHQQIIQAIHGTAGEEE